MTDNPTLPLVEEMARAIWFARRNRQRVALGYEPLKGDEDIAIEGITWAEALEAAQAAAAIAQRRVSELEAALEAASLTLIAEDGGHMSEEAALVEVRRIIEAAHAALAKDETA